MNCSSIFSIGLSDLARSPPKDAGPLVRHFELIAMESLHFVLGPDKPVWNGLESGRGTWCYI